MRFKIRTVLMKMERPIQIYVEILIRKRGSGITARSASLVFRDLIAITLGHVQSMGICPDQSTLHTNMGIYGRLIMAGDHFLIPIERIDGCCIGEDDPDYIPCTLIGIPRVTDSEPLDIDLGPIPVNITLRSPVCNMRNI